MIKKLIATLLAGLMPLCLALPSLAVEQLSDIPATSAVLIEQTTGEVLFEKNSHQHVAPASITKIMTMLLVMEEMEKGNLSIDDKLTCSEYASHMGGSEIWLELGEQMSVEDLLKAVFIASANDAAVVFAEHIAGSEDEFVNRMNKRAKEMCLEDTNFVNCTGFDEQGHYTSAYDVAKMAGALMQYPLVTKYATIWIDTLRGGKTELTNTNRLVRFYNGITGLKTGHTDEAGSCLCATATRNNLKLISVVMKCQSISLRNIWSARLLDYGFANFEFTAVPSVDPQLLPIKVSNGIEPIAEIYAEYPNGILLPKGSSSKIEQDVTIVEKLTAPIDINQNVGKVVVSIDGKPLTEYVIKTKYAIPKMTFSKAMLMLFKKVIQTN
ncbi:MAG: D-alanyl-D-alanine carboxypeptidase family protein [Oscillospiraceae bacterium]